MPYVVIDRIPERVQTVLEHGGLAVEADASREEVLVRVGIHRARGLIAAVGTDAENVYTVLSARVLRPDLFIIARVEAEDAEAKLRRAGADRVISPYTLGAIQIARTALRPAVVDFMRLATSSERLDLSAEQIELAARPPFVDVAARGNFRQRFGVIVVAINGAGRAHAVQSVTGSAPPGRRPARCSLAAPSSCACSTRKPARRPARRLRVSARRLDGTATAAVIRGELSAAITVHGGARASAGSRHRARGRRPGLRDYARNKLRTAGAIRN